MVLMAVEIPIRAIREQSVAALDIIVQIGRLPTGQRRVTHVTEIVGIDPDTENVITEDIFLLPMIKARMGKDAFLRHTGYIPAFAQDLIDSDFLDVGVFT